MPETKQFETQVLVIGGGVTGTGVARDLALRGISCIVLERQTINAGASGRNHGLLHSGARYVGSDPASAAECKKEGDILKKIAPHCIEETGGFFVAVPGDDEAYISDFPAKCRAAGIPCESMDVRDARQMEPALSPDIIAAFRVEDAAVEPFHISLENMNQAIELGSRYFNFCEVVKMTLSAGHIKKVTARDLVNRRIFEIRARVVVNAAGAWSGLVAQKAGIKVGMVYSKGSLLITHHRLAERVINRLRPPSDGDILVPGGTVSIFGTTAFRVDHPDNMEPEITEIDAMVDEGLKMVPELSGVRYIRAYTGVRPLVTGISADASDDDRAISRGFSLMDHTSEGVHNFVTITGGKMTTFRLMAQKACDLVAGKLGNTQKCRTAKIKLRSKAPSAMTEAGMSLKWKQGPIKPGDITMCECEMISKSQFEILIHWLKKNRKTSDLNALRIHSRLGACQGTFCSQRVTGFMYDEDYLKNDDGIHNIKDLLYERFRGQRPVLWNGQLAQAELNEALYCAFYGLDLES